jgi:glycosyltransferase involved in cell wall biosynthesis
MSAKSTSTDIPIAFLTHQYPDDTQNMAGGEIYMENLLLVLLNYGIRSQIYVIGKPSKQWTRNGLPVTQLMDGHCIPDIHSMYISQLGYEKLAITLSVNRSKKCLIVIHNSNKNNDLRCLGGLHIPVIYNSFKALHDLNNFHGNPDWYVLPPIIKDFNCSGDKDDGYITLINPIPVKGVEVFKMLTELLPDRKFLVVQGGYYCDRAILNWGDNVTVIPQQKDMQHVYKMTRILLCPSIVETWGMAVAEAQYCGIPVIANYLTETGGLIENVGHSALWVYGTYNLDQWIDRIKYLDNPMNYLTYSKRGKRNQVNNVPDMEEFFKWFIHKIDIKDETEKWYIKKKSKYYIW